MTTIAVRGNTMASDACHNQGDGTIFVLQSKLHRTEHGLIIGGAGDCSDRDLLALLDKVKNPASLPSLNELSAACHRFSDLSMLILFPNREIWCLDRTIGDHGDGPMELFRMHAPFAAIGSGQAAAMTAMRMGASAPRAVEEACKCDIYSRPPVFYEQIRSNAKKKIIKRKAK